MLEVEFVEAGIHLDRGSWRRVAAPAGHGADGARASGWVLYESMGPLLAGRALLGAGRPDEAAAELERALASATASGATGTAALAGAALEQARALAGRPPPVVPGAAAPPEEVEVEVEAIRSETTGLAALAAGQPEEAAAAFARAVDLWRQLGLTVWLGRALSLQAAAARRGGDRPAADRLLAQAGEVLDGLKTPAQARPTVLSPLADQRDERGG